MTCRYFTQVKRVQNNYVRVTLFLEDGQQDGTDKRTTLFYPSLFQDVSAIHCFLFIYLLHSFRILNKYCTTKFSNDKFGNLF